MDISGEIYLYTLSLVAVSFAVVSALVMRMRHSMGGKLSGCDVYLNATYVSVGLLLSIIALLPPLIALFGPTPRNLWAVSSGLAAVVFAVVLASIIKRRRKVSPEPMSLAVKTSFCLHGISIFVLLVNSVVEPWQGAHLHASALTVSLASVSWAFVPRIASVLGDSPSNDWDPKSG